MKEIVRLKILSTGYCTASEHHTIKGGRRQSIRFYATVGLIKHPTQGYILFDTGYSNRFYTATRSLPYKLYAWSTKVYHNESESVLRQLEKHGISPDEITTIIVSHFHADHIGGLLDFPNAQFICSRKAYEDIIGRKGFSAVRKGYLPQLMPKNFAKRAILLDFEGQVMDPILGPTIDLFDDGSIIICLLEGHACGQIGVILATKDNPTFLCADAAWVKANYKDLTLPNSIVRLFFDSWSSFKESLGKINTYHQAYPDHLIIPCHCQETMDYVFKKQADGYL